MASRQELELLIQAKAITDQAFKQVQQQVRGLGTAVKKQSVLTRDLEKDFKAFSSRYSTGFSIMKKSAIAFTLALGATAAAVGFLAVKGREIVGIENSFKSLTAAAGESADVMMQTLRPATLGAISDLELMQRTNQALLLGIPANAKGMGELATAAVKLGDAMGLTASMSLESMITGLGRQSILWLDNLGLVIDSEAAYASHAAQLGKNVEQLTEAEKKTAFYNATLAAAQERVAQLGDTQQSLGLSLSQVSTQFENFTNGLAKAITLSPALGSVLQGIAKSMKDAFDDPEELVEKLVEQVENATFVMLDLAKFGVQSARQLSNAWNAVPHLFRQVMLEALQLAENLAAVEVRALELRQDLDPSEHVARMLGTDTDLSKKLRGLRGDRVDRKRRIAELEVQISKGAISEFDDQMALMLGKIDELRIDAANAGRDIGRNLGGGIADGVEEGVDAVDKLTGALTEAEKAARTALERDFIGAGVSQFRTLTAQGTPFDTSGTDLSPGSFNAGPGLAPVVLKGRDLGQVFEGLTHVVSATAGEFDQVPQIVENVARAFEKAEDGAGKFAAIASGIAQIGGLIGGKAGGVIQGAAGGAMAGAQFGPIGAVAGGVIGGAMSLFGPGEEETVNDQRDQFFSQWENGFIGLQEQLQGLTNQDLVKKIFDAETVDEFNAAVSEAMGLLDTQAAAQEALNDAASRYNFTIAEMGPTFRQQELDAMAGQLISDWQLLSQAGFDHSAMLRELGPGMQEYIDAALEAGVAIPEALRGPIEEMIALGQLTDDEGNAFESLEESGLTFTETLSEGLGRLITTLEEFIAALSGDIPPVTIPVSFGSPTGGPPGGSGFDPNQFLPGGPIPGQGFAHEGFVPFTPGGGRSVRVGETQTERIVSDESLAAIVARANRMMGGGGGGGGTQRHVFEHRFSPPEIARWLERQSRSGALRTHPDSVTRQGT